jgi:long-chain acyl-CoA synthetase
VTLAGLMTGLPDEAIYAGAEVVSKERLSGSAAELATQLSAAGVRQGQLVAAMLPNAAVTVAALFGVWNVPAVYAPLNPRASDQELRNLIDTLDPAAVVTTAQLAGRFHELPGAPVTVVQADGLDWSIAWARDRRDTVVFDPDIALVQFTSGTTGPPKPVPMRHSTVLDLIDRFIPPANAARRPKPNLVPVSLSLWAGIYQVLFAFRRGAAAVLMDRFDTGEFARLVKTFGLRSTVLPPACLTMLLDDPTIDELAPLRTVRSITAPLSPVQARRFRDRFGVVVVNSYGQTELGGQVVGWSAADERDFSNAKLGSVGRALPGIELQISDGEVLVRSPATTGGLIADAFRDRLTSDGWFHTGDLGEIDDDGFLWLSGRLSDMINRGGNKVFPAHVEEVLAVAPGVSEVAVVGVPDERLGEVPWAFVVCHGGFDEASLVQWCRDRLTPYKVPVRIVAVPALPRNEVGKIVKRQLAELAAAASKNPSART